MDWTPEDRLRIIKAILAIGVRDETFAQFKVRIMFACDMPARFLEINRDQYEDAIKLAEADITIVI